jgi:hypothetical protein
MGSHSLGQYRSTLGATKSPRTIYAGNRHQ